MTPEQKAIELVDEFRMILMREDTECGNEILCTMIAKECALIAVDEVINTEALEPQLKRHKVNNIQPRICELEYWFNVKTEIQKF